MPTEPLKRTARDDDQLRAIGLEPGAVPYAEGSCKVVFGNTTVLCAASVEEKVPSWKEAIGSGWVTAEYAMLPRSTHTRRRRERSGTDGRTSEIQRLIGRSLRSVCDLDALGPRTVTVDCDVLQADGGTRTAAITGGCVALGLAFRSLVELGRIEASPLRDLVAAISAGLVDARPMLDLDYREDVRAQVDMNIVGSGSGRLVEVQGAAEGNPFSREAMDQLLDLGLLGISALVRRQRQILSEVPLA